MKRFALVMLSLLFALPACAQESVEVTVYNQNFALIKDQRYFDLDKGVNKLEFKDVAALIEPTSVHFNSLTAPASAGILEQNYEYDLVNASKLLYKYIDRKIKVMTKQGDVYEGTLMSYDDNQLVIQTANGIAMVARPDNINQITFEKLPEGLITKPTLVWLVNSDKRLRHLTEVSYLTQGMNWNCEYVTVLDKDDKAIDLDGWVSITNNCGATYEDAKIKLIAGEVKRASNNMYFDRVAKSASGLAEKDESQFEEKSFFEYHMYTMQRLATIKNNQTKQLALLNSTDVPVKKELIFDPSKGKNHWWYYSDNSETLKEKARVEITFMNSKASKLGMPLPKGNVKVYKKDTDGSLQFIGEDSIEHTPKDEKIRLYIGDAFDVVGERTRKDFKTEGHHIAYETFEIVLRNHKEQDTEIKVVEKLWRYTNWDIVASSVNFEKKDASTMEYLAKVPKNGETKLTYTVKYTW